MTLEIRAVRDEEFDAVGELTVAAYRDDGFVTGGPYLDVLRDTADRAADTDVVVAVEGDDVLGTVTLVGPDAPPRWRENDRNRAGTVRMLAVAKRARGRGVGRALAQWCIDEARRRGWRELTLVTQPTMHAAHRIYEQAGFVRDPELDFVVEGVDGGELTLLGFSLLL
jgi:GNAT superfamily N-acetyltransferase